MAINADATYGLDIAATLDADEFLSSCTGLALVQQDAFHRVTTDDILGPGGIGWGRDVRHLLGMPASRLSGQQPLYSEVLTRDDRIQTADVTITATKTANGLADVRFEALCMTALGPFPLTIASVANLTDEFIEAQAPS